MADWHVSSAAHAAVPVYTISTAYTVGQFVRRVTSTPKAQWVMRCTVAGTSAASEPTWPTTNNGTVVSGGATFQNVTGQSTYGWSAAAGDLPTLLGAVGTFRFAAGDRMFVSSDHSETQTTATSYGSGAGTVGFASGQVLSVNRAGSLPPVAADLTPGAAITVGTGLVSLTLETSFPTYHYGISYIYTGTSATAIQFGSGAQAKGMYFDACQFYLNTATPGCTFRVGVGVNIVLKNTTFRFGAVGQSINPTTPLDIVWLDTPSAFAGAIFPTSFLVASASPQLALTARGVDLSALTGTLAFNNSTGSIKVLLDSCRIASGLTRYAAGLATRDLVELINCYDGTSILSESYQVGGAVTTERTITLSGGAADDVGTFSHKLVSNANVDKYVNPLLGFWMDIEQQAIGASKTATVEMISSASLNNDEISLLLEYQGTSGSPVASFGTNMPATVLTTAAAVTTSTATWNSSPATPAKQKLEVTFTPQLAGRVRGQVRLGKPSATVYVNPVIVIA